jgi:hypothetical protein
MDVRERRSPEDAVWRRRRGVPGFGVIAACARVLWAIAVRVR